ncbi:MAG: glycosyltransferase family 4 protein [Thermoanaerobaculum sp.]
MRLKVGFDGKPLLRPKAGVARYAEGLLSGLATLPPEELEVVVVYPEKPTRTAPWVLWNLQKATRRGFSVFHFPFYYTPLFPACPVTVAIHDVLVLSHPQWFPKACANTLRWLIPITARKASAIVTGSRWVAQEIVRLCRVPRRRVRVIPPGVDRRLFAPPAPTTLAQELLELGLNRPYLLMVGALEPRRGVDTLLSAWEILRPRFPELELVLAGPLRSPVAALAQRPKEVRLLGYVEDRVLPVLYAGAQVVVAPSRGEGFDLPVLEALACGACVVASDIPVHREVFSGAVRFFAAGDAEALAAELREVLDNAQERQKLRESGLVLAESFSWEKAAREHWALWREVA